MKLTKRLFLGLAASTAIASMPLAALADGWKPKRPIDFTIMAGAGGGADMFAYLMKMMPVLKALDADQDGELSQKEIERIFWPVQVTIKSVRNSSFL